MSEDTTCGCGTGCTNKRCSCYKQFEGCDGDACTCTDCENPYNEIDPEQYSTCALDHIEHVLDLSDEELSDEQKLPCGHQRVPLNDLLGWYECSGCEQLYYYSFCWDQPVQDSHDWHCKPCGACREWREWHCDNCDRCTYGVTQDCSQCGKASPMANIE